MNAFALRMHNVVGIAAAIIGRAPRAAQRVAALPTLDPFTSSPRLSAPRGSGRGSTTSPFKTGRGRARAKATRQMQQRARRAGR